MSVGGLTLGALLRGTPGSAPQSDRISPFSRLPAAGAAGRGAGAGAVSREPAGAGGSGSAAGAGAVGAAGPGAAGGHSEPRVPAGQPAGPAPVPACAAGGTALHQPAGGCGAPRPPGGTASCLSFPQDSSLCSACLQAPLGSPPRPRALSEREPLVDPSLHHHLERKIK